ncbi:LLM class flavin-dependent oxidoreductase [Nocardia pseudobrasiliensis]|uniref:Phthiodiolone/phenolphthiodiolone dimycocerosates ketoreductase n=1 Tax=Nocardia pseudobrasiliensis TaxID=45979 RepID=A0A370IBY3_9NOCA|nr:LLM class flavin-dependent oxidoreductase [Nocardia pseudobrasiliensis]RDI68238.1 phthiodiolone/phenolphthiodiolone dimycocerosates ketoreductase [Nocardia pseudobrasiliensis]
MTVKVGLVWDAAGSVEGGRGLLELARVHELDAFLIFDHLINTFPSQAWDTDFTYLASALPTPDRCLDFATVLGNFASHAGPVQLAVGVTDPHRRHPAVLAQTALTLAQFTERPPVLGIGTGASENLQPYGVAHDHRVGRVEEALRIVRMMLDGAGPHDFEGRHFTLDRALMGLRAPEGREPRLWVGANRSRMLTLTGRYADGWLPSELVAPDEYARRLSVVRKAAAAAGRDPNAIVASGGIPIVVAETDRRAHQLLHANPIRFLALHASAAAWASHGAVHPFGVEYKGLTELLPHVLTRGEVRQAMAAVPERIVAEQVLVGSRQTVLERIGALVEAGLEHPMLIPVSAMASPDDAAYTLETVAWLARELRATSPIGETIS